MKRLILSIAAIAAVAGPMAFSATSAFADDDRGRGRGNHEQRGDRGDHRGDRDRGDRRDYRSDRGDRYDRRDDHRGRYNPRDHRPSYSNWDRGRHNGYYYNNRWFYGPPPQAYYGNPYYRPGYASWRRGSSLPPYYRSYVVNDYHRYHLRQPPRGYAWYRVGNDYLLAAIASGIVFDIIANGS
ncbi:MAG: RcnB family protein [Pseudomonadota bacterium]|uniref:RcnB family protein n=1 Tax=Phenylobacterium sp. TaxID=1871053 RepID=UPI00271F5A2B|nr:RcnB family protein [Phenylobacterium sp.]MDO9431537.1 RcnB family protein [Phenylobacterium sp.]